METKSDLLGKQTSRCRQRMTYWENRPEDGDKEWPAGKTDQQMETKNGLLGKQISRCRQRVIYWENRPEDEEKE
ncbi:hypothetical protein PoB_001330000 [Plakobranchus ocellatus]|uniref:Uncharacterized protein n=1 Tax=Plakobranchus ocellatus TaxID=259542 RepID=A0AAV3YUE0_9GAST|nr:hypothetical protein PoB_001330000 [Plakobranchus ocellatus]